MRLWWVVKIEAHRADVERIPTLRRFASGAAFEMAGVDLRVDSSITMPPELEAEIAAASRVTLQIEHSRPSGSREDPTLALLGLASIPLWC